MTTNEHQPALADDLVWDIPNIAVEINRTPRQTHYLIERGQLPVTKVGPRKYAALRSELRRWFAETIPTSAPKDPILPREKPQPRVNLIATYADLPCRITGEEYCLHIDWRMTGSEALRRAGIRSANDLINFDYREFWRKRLILREINYSALGRMLWNRGKQQKRRTEWVKTFGPIEYHVDRRMGYIVATKYGSTQAVIDRFRKEINVNRCLIPIDVEHLLPR